MSRIRLIQGVAKGLATASKSPIARKVGQAALNQAKRLKTAANGAKPIAQKIAKEKAKATGKPVRTSIDTAARRQSIARQAARSANNPPSGERLLLQEKGVVRTTRGTRLAPGVKNDAVKKPPISRTTKPTKAEQVRQVKSGLRDRGAAHVQTRVPQDTNATTNRARGSRLDQSPGAARGKFSEANKEVARQAVRRGQENAKISGDVRENARTAGRNAAQRYRGKAAKIVSDRMSTDKALEMSGVDRRTMRNRLETRAKEGERRVRQAAEDQVTGVQRGAKLNRSPSSSSQDIGRTGSRRSLAQTQASAQRLSADMSARKAAGKLPEIKKDPSAPPKPPTKQFLTPSDRAKDLQEIKKAAQNAPRAQAPQPRPADKRASDDFARSKLSQTGRVTPNNPSNIEKQPNPVRNGQELKPQGTKSVPTSMEVSQRRAENLPKPGPQKPAEAAQKAQQNASDAALRQRNQGTSTPRTSVTPNRSQGSTTGAAAAANRSTDRQGNNLQRMADQVLRQIGWSGRR